MKYLIIFIFCFSYYFVNSQVLQFDSLNRDSCIEINVSFNKKQIICFDNFHKLTRYGYLINGKQVGEWHIYMDGRLLKVGKYKNDKKVGIWKEYYLDGKELFIGKFKNNMETGAWRVYLSEVDLRICDDKKLIRLAEIRKYKKGKLIEKKVYDKSNKLVKKDIY